MKKLSCLICCVTLVYGVNSQSFSDSLKSHYMNVYNQGIKYNDISLAIGGLQGYLAIENNILYRDTLSMLYFSSGSYYTSLLLSQEVHQASPENIRSLARIAECYRNLGESKKAIEAYEKVAPLLKEPYYYYQLAASQYTLKRLGECEENLKKVIADSASSRTAVNFSLDDGRVQQVPVNAAANNFLGILKMEVNDLQAAHKYLELAVKQYPEFLGAQQNLLLCVNKMKPSGKPGTKPKTN